MAHKRGEPILTKKPIYAFFCFAACCFFLYVAASCIELAGRLINIVCVCLPTEDFNKITSCTCPEKCFASWSVLMIGKNICKEK